MAEKNKKEAPSGVLGKADKKVEEKANEDECGCCCNCGPKKDDAQKADKKKGCCG